ncbi:MAG: Glutathione transport system permease protein GsiC [Paracidovorax wautersii]|uniref:Glutathione transport system permease protein GsiC n=1 Tax=Paracidovorax wautersii TaxID=1177982 RepID=A0A7V8JPU0_9BURK|nr:MAG: Glutathione transport system permease protein GsiC [Paracidovorax wautersii]
MSTHARSYVIRRVAQAAAVIALAYTFVFFILFILPGDPIRQQIENPQNPLPQAEASILLAYYNLDKPAFTQFTLAVGRLLHGDWGYSLTTGKPVAALIAQAIPQTLALASSALLLSILLSLLIALLAAFSPWPTVRAWFEALPGIFLSTPSFLVGVILLQIFSFTLGWVSSIRDEGFKSVILPAVTLALAVSAPIAQVLIQGLRKNHAEPFVNILRSKGVRESTIIFRHVLKNSAIPALTLLGLTVGELLAGSVVTETIFSRTGIGFLTQQAVREQDTPVILAVVSLVATVFVLIVLVTDLLYPFIDPRITTYRRPLRPESAHG